MWEPFGEAAARDEAAEADRSDESPIRFNIASSSSSISSTKDKSKVGLAFIL